MAHPPNLQKLLDLLYTFIPALKPDHRHGKTLETREPIAYDEHLPQVLQFLTTGFDPELLQTIEEFLVKTLEKNEGLKDGTFDAADFIRSSQTLIVQVKKINKSKATNESSVKKVQQTLHGLVSMLATIAAFKVTSDQAANAVFGVKETSEPNTRADVLVGVLAGGDDDVEDWDEKVWDEIISQNLTDPFFDYLYSEEYKNIILGNPRLFLAIHILIWCMAKRLLITFWPRFDCTGCVKFKNSHAVAEGAAKAPVEVPLDAEERDDVQKNRKDDNQASDNDFQGKEDDDSGEEGSDEEKLDRIEVEADVRQEIATLLDLIKSYDEEHGVTPELKKAMKGTEGPSFEHEHHRFMPQLMAAAEKLGVPEEIMPTMRKWFTFAVYVLVQVWSQMVRHNTTVARLTSHNLGIVVLRDREEQRMTISKIFTHEHQLLQMTGLTVYALDDGKKRHARHIEKGVPFWKVDWFRGGGPDIEVEEEDSDGDEGRKRGQKRRKVVPASDDSDGDDHGGDDSDQDDGAGGSNGPAPGPGSDQKKLGRKDDGRSHRNDRSNQSGKSVGGQSWAGVTGLALLHLDVQNVHLGFRLSNGMLWSTGFSCLKRIDLSSAVETIASEKKMAPARHEYPSSETDTSSITTPAASPQRVTASSGALGRTGSDSSVGTASSVGTLFGSQASAAPSSPATTLSFSTGSESGDSPTRQGRGKLSIGSLETSVDSVLDETLSPEDLDTTQTTPVNERVPRLQSRFIHDVGILLDAAVSTGSTGIVWSGKMVLEGTEQVEEQLAIVVKLATAKEGPDVEGGMESDEAEELRKEGAVYEFLASQGDRADITPRYCGTFKDNRGSVALVLEHRGKALKSFDNLTKDQAELLLQKAKDLHSLRVNHGALFPCNIVQDDQGDLRIIDFHGAYVHSCPGERCRELVDFAKALGLKTEIA